MEWPRPEPGLVSSSRRPRMMGSAICSGVRPGPSSSTRISSQLPAPLPGGGSGAAASDDLGARPLGGVVEQVAQHLLEVLPLALEAGAGRAVHGEGELLVAIDALERAHDRFARPGAPR